MKSYFAKLAARATLANVPASRPANSANAGDPFQETGPQPGISNLVGDAQLNASVQPPVPRVTPQSSTEVSRPRTLETDTFEPRARNTKHTSASAEDEVVNFKQLRQPSSDVPITLEHRETEKRSRADSPGFEQPQVDSTRLSPQVHKSTQQLPISPKEKDKTQSTAFAETNERLTDIENEQRALLRKADAFMAGLFVNPQRSDLREEPEVHEARQMESVRTEHSRDAPPRLQPIARPPRVAEPVDDEPSVVIEKLLVEIMPTPAPPAPVRQIVVVRGGGERTRSHVPSGQRFGFSRY